MKKLVDETRIPEKGKTVRPNAPLFMMGSAGTTVERKIKNKDKSDTGKRIIATFGVSILDNDRTVSMLAYEYAIRHLNAVYTVGIDVTHKNKKKEKIKKKLEQFTDKTRNEAIYHVVRIDAGVLSNEIYGNLRRKKRIQESLNNLSNVTIKMDGIPPTLSLIRNVKYDDDGLFTFEVPNVLRQYFLDNLLVYRKDKTLQYSKLANRVSCYIETRQYKRNGKWYPPNVIHIEEFFEGLFLDYSDKSNRAREIKRLENVFIDIHIHDPQTTLYVYNKTKKWFENRFKNKSTLDWNHYDNKIKKEKALRNDKI